MKITKSSFYLALILLTACSTFIQMDQHGWQRVFGENVYTEAYDIISCRDGGYFVTGMSMISSNNTDVYLLKIDPNGNEEWQLELGGESFDMGYAAVESSKGGFVVAGYTESYGNGQSDGWIIGIESNGTVVWNYTFGGSYPDELYDIQKVPSGGYILCGMTLSYSDENDGYDYWVMKINNRGILEWQSMFHGNDYDSASAIQSTFDSGYIVVGRSGELSMRNGKAMVLKLDQYGEEIWRNEYGDHELQVANSVQATPASNFLIAGYCMNTSDDDAEGWLTKIDQDGEVLWDQTYGFKNWDNIKSIELLEDGSILAAGVTARKPLFAPEDENIWIIKINSSGEEIWQESFGGKGHDVANSVVQAEEGGFVISGRSGDDGNNTKENSDDLSLGYNLFVIKFNI